MKKSVLKVMQLFTWATLLFFVSCTKNPVPYSENPTANETIKNNFPLGIPNPFHRRIGAPVSAKTGSNWIAQYNAIHGTRIYYLDNGYLQSILNNPKCVGISLWYAKNNNKNYIIPAGVDNMGKTIKSDNIKTADGYINWNTAQQWMASSNEPLKSHFFGANTFDRLHIKECQDKSTRVDWAINTSTNKQVLLLSNPSCVENIVQPYEDESAACPNQCPN